jgi:peptide/nickel transport system ATP-binding protein
MAKTKAVELLELVQVAGAEEIVRCYPHQLSGGLCQRVMIAMAIACHPPLLIADEPTTALDNTVQLQIIKLLKDLKTRLGMSIMIITHDLSVAAEICDRVYVMYAGRVVEECDILNLFKSPRHPYTQGLLASIPRIGSGEKTPHGIPGTMPNPLNYPMGCRFHPRCSFVMEKCRSSDPMPTKVGLSTASCWLYEGESS